MPQDVELNLEGIPDKDNNYVLAWATFGQNGDPAAATLSNIQWHPYSDDPIDIDEPGIDPKGCNAHVGSMSQVDPEVGKNVTLKCPGGCIQIYKSTFGCKPEPGSPDPYILRHSNIVKQRCNGKEECLVHSCPAYFGDPDSDYGCDEKSTWIVWG